MDLFAPYVTAFTIMMAPVVPYLTPFNLTLGLIAVNFAAFAAFGIDKARAEHGWRRTPEAALLRFALFGGTGGAYAGRHLFRHKTRKQPFTNNLHTIAILQSFTAAIGAGWFLG